jgi:hypothetical protein
VSSPLPSRLEPYLSLACSHAWFLSAAPPEWTPSSLYGLNSLTPHGLAHMARSSVPRRRKGTIAYITALLRPVFPPFSIHLRSSEPIIRG